MPAVCQVNNIDIDLIYSDTIEENIISIDTKKELFFDVYECTINDEKLVLEKVGDSELGPKVLLEINIEGKKYSAEAILVDNGSTYVELNKENIYFIRTIPNENLTVEESEVEESEVEDETSDNVEVNYENIIEHHVNNKLVFLHELEEQFEEKIVSLKDDISNKLDLFFEKLEDKKKVIVEEKLEKITADLNEKFTVLQSELQGVEDFSKQNIDNILETKINEIDSSVNLFLEGITKEYKNKIISSDKKITHNFLELNSIKEKLKENNSTTNKKFEELNSLKEKLLEQDELVLKNEELKKFINEEFKDIDSKFKNLSEEENKKYDELLAAFNNKDVVEYKTILKEKIQDVELTQIKESLQEEISSALKGDIVSLKRYVEMSSGGGSVAKQFAAGGTMDGTLNVNGNILSGGTNLIDIFNSDTSINLQDVTNNGNTTTNLISSNNTIIADTILATNILSATNLDIGFELSGFNVTGNLSASGNISSGSLTTPALSTDGIDAKFTDNVIIAGDLDVGFPNENENQCITIHGSNSSGKRTQLIQTGGAFCIHPIIGNQCLILGSLSNHITMLCGNASHELRIPTGKVNIGTTGGTEKLTVAGNISASGNLSAADIKGTKIISTGNLELGGNIVDTDANEIITIDSNDVCFNGKSVRAGQSLGLRGVRGNSKGMDQSGGSDHTKLGIFNCSIEAMTVDTAGKVGINTTSPTEVLTVSGNISATNTIASSAGHFADAVGIGTTSPEAKLDISYSGFSGKYARISRGTSNIDFDLDAGGVCMKSTVKTFHIGTCDSQPLRLLTNNSTRVCITETGNVGIGATSPTELLTVSGNISASGDLSANNVFSGGLAVCTSVPTPSTPTLQQVTTQGNTTSNSLFVDGLSATKITSGINSINTGAASFIGGGINNKVTGVCASVITGNGLSATGFGSVAGGGYRNCAGGGGTFVGSGRYNCAIGSYSNIGSGYRNQTLGTYSVVVGGFRNIAHCAAAFTGGGKCNQALSACSTMVGGGYNKSCGIYTSIVGGKKNCATGACSFVGGGYYNRSCGTHSFVGGGYTNRAIGSRSFIGSGQNNQACGVKSFVGGGSSSLAKCVHSSVVGGYYNYACGDYSFVGGGVGNHARGHISFIGNGNANRTEANNAIVVGGQSNYACGACSVIVGGGGQYKGNRTIGTASVIVGGVKNLALSSEDFIGGGFSNTAAGSAAVIVGGCFNRTFGTTSSVVGGCYNNNYSSFGSILGGASNRINSDHNSSFIIGTSLSSNAACTTFVNNLSTPGVINSCSITSLDGVRVGGGSIITCAASFTPSLSDNGRTLLLDTTSGTINVTFTPQISGYSARYIKEAGASPVVFSTGTGLSGLYSYQDRNQMSIIYAQADIFYKNETIAFLGGNLQ